MTKFVYKIATNAGYYNLVVDYDENRVIYKTKALRFSKSKEGELNKDDVKRFNKLIKKTKLLSWYIDEEERVPKFMDEPEYEICCIDDEGNSKQLTFSELDAPKEYKYLLEAIGIIDEDYYRFMNN